MEDVKGIDRIERYDQLHKIPKEFYEVDIKNDKLAEEIRELSLQKPQLQLILEDIYKKIKADKLLLLINTSKEKYCFIQSHQIGFEDIKKIEKVFLNKDNMLIRRVYFTKRMTYVPDIDKLNNIFNNDEFKDINSDMKSLFIYPIKLFGRIRSLIFFFFRKEESNKLDILIDILEKNKQKLIKNLI